MGSKDIKQCISGYVLEKELASGAMGVVYRARMGDSTLKRAIKVLQINEVDEQTQARFKVELEALGTLDMPGIVKVHHANLDSSPPYLVMELIEGDELANHMDEEWSPMRAAICVKRILDTMQGVHEAGIIHRDLKPQNIFLCRNDEPKLIDFGLARIAEGSGLTKTGDMLGTPVYMAPEQIMAYKGEIDAQVDVWAVGVIAYQLLAGRLPYTNKDVVGLMTEITQMQPPKVTAHAPEVPEELADIVAKALKKDREKRWKTAGEMSAAISVWLDKEMGGTEKKASSIIPADWAMTGILLAIAAGLLVWMYSNGRL